MKIPLTILKDTLTSLPLSCSILRWPTEGGEIMDDTPRPRQQQLMWEGLKAGMGTPCWEAQADGVPCIELGIDCAACERAAATDVTSYGTATDRHSNTD